MAERNAWGFSLFCDDIRTEIGGKISLMGIYQNDMLIQADFPTVLPKFAILVKYYEIPEVFKDSLTINVFMPGDIKGSPAMHFQVPRESSSPTAQYPLEDDQERIFNVTLPLIFSPLPVSQEGFIKVRAVTGQTTTNLGSLMIRKLRPDDKIPGVTS
jgi:hypothetical protein